MCLLARYASHLKESPQQSWPSRTDAVLARPSTLDQVDIGISDSLCDSPRINLLVGFFVKGRESPYHLHRKVKEERDRSTDAERLPQSGKRVGQWLYDTVLLHSDKPQRYIQREADQV